MILSGWKSINVLCLYLDEKEVWPEPSHARLSWSSYCENKAAASPRKPQPRPEQEGSGPACAIAAVNQVNPGSETQRLKAYQFTTPREQVSRSDAVSPSRLLLFLYLLQ